MDVIANAAEANMGAIMCFFGIKQKQKEIVAHCI